MNVVIMAGGTSGLQVPDYRKHGFDFFVVLQGCGWLHTADVEDGQISAAGWRHQRLERGDSYSIEPNKAHCLLNDQSNPLYQQRSPLVSKKPPGGAADEQ